jgi:Ca-activated chloride channel family protein
MSGDAVLALQLGGIGFRDPGLLFVAALIPLALLHRRRAAPLAVEFAPAGFLEAAGTRRGALAALPLGLVVLALLLLVVGAARPGRYVAQPATNEGIDLALAIDVSSSMTEGDLDASRTRLEVAIDVATDLVERRIDDRVAIVTFARHPDLVAPPTADTESLVQRLAAIEPVERDSSEDATAIGAAVARAAHVLAQSEAGGAKVVVLITDGEENVAVAGLPDEIAPADAAQLAVRFGVKVHAVVVGAGDIDTRAVARLAERTGGALHRAADAATLAAVTARIDVLEKAPAAAPRFVFTEAFGPFVLGALGLLVLAAVLRGPLGGLP